MGKDCRIVSGDSPVFECEDDVVKRNPGPGDVAAAVALVQVDLLIRRLLDISPRGALLRGVPLTDQGAAKSQ